jgi:hypothetical protein
MVASLKINLAPHATTARVSLHRSHHIPPPGRIYAGIVWFSCDIRIETGCLRAHTGEPLCFDPLSHTSVTDLQARQTGRTTLPRDVSRPLTEDTAQVGHAPSYG